MGAKEILRWRVVGRRAILVIGPVVALLVLQLEGIGAADVSVRWKRSTQVELESVASGAGGVYVTGYGLQDGGSSEPAMVLSRYGPNGDLIWTRSWLPRRARTNGTDVAVGSNGSVYVAGDVGAENMEGGGWFIRKYSASGTLRWQRTSRNWRRPEAAMGIDAVAVAKQMVVVVGNTFGCCGEVFNDGWVRAYRPNGTLRWTNRFEASSPTGTDDRASDVAIGSGGRVYVAGWIATGPEADLHMADHEIMVQALGSTGSVIWTRVFFERDGRDRDGATAVAVRGHRLMVTAEAGGRWADRPTHAWLARLTLNGGVVWTRSWGRDPDRAAQPSSVSLGPTGATYVVGTQVDPSDDGTDAFIRTYSSGGRLLARIALEEGTRYLAGTHVSALRHGAYVTARMWDEASGSTGGWLWRLDA